MTRAVALRSAASGLVVAALLAASAAPAQESQRPPTSVTASVAAAPARHAKGDPWEKLNRRLFNSQQGFDRSFFRPLAVVYTKIFPKFLRTGLRHLLLHIKEPIVFLHDVLQLKPKHAAKTLARFVINTTAGVGGLFDVAKTAKLPHRDNGLGNTLARYGVGPGPYLFLPFIGPTDLRDVLGGQADGLIYPVAIGSPFNRYDYIIGTTAIGGLDRRVENDAQLKALLDGAADPYATLRSIYLQNRLAEIAAIKDQTIEPALQDDLVDPEAAGETPAPDSTDAQLPPAVGASAVDAPAVDPAQADAVPTPVADPAPADVAPATSPSAAATAASSGLPQPIGSF